MKKIYFVLFALAMVVLLPACHKDEDDNGGNSNSYGTIGGGGSTNNNDLEKEGTDERPDWKVIEDYNPTAYMLLTIDEDNMPVAVSDGDLLGAFVGGECRGLARPAKGIDDVMRFYMTICTCEENEHENVQGMVVVKYYSAAKHRIYESEEFKFVQGQALGSSTESYSTKWK